MADPNYLFQHTQRAYESMNNNMNDSNNNYNDNATNSRDSAFRPQTNHKSSREVRFSQHTNTYEYDLENPDGFEFFDDTSPSSRLNQPEQQRSSSASEVSRKQRHAPTEPKSNRPSNFSIRQALTNQLSQKRGSPPKKRNNKVRVGNYFESEGTRSDSKPKSVKFEDNTFSKGSENSENSERNIKSASAFNNFEKNVADRLTNRKKFEVLQPYLTISDKQSKHHAIYNNANSTQIHKASISDKDKNNKLNLFSSRYPSAPSDVGLAHSTKPVKSKGSSNSNSNSNSSSKSKQNDKGALELQQRMSKLDYLQLMDTAYNSNRVKSGDSNKNSKRTQDDSEIGSKKNVARAINFGKEFHPHSSNINIDSSNTTNIKKIRFQDDTDLPRGDHNKSNFPFVHSQKHKARKGEAHVVNSSNISSNSKVTFQQKRFISKDLPLLDKYMPGVLKREQRKENVNSSNSSDLFNIMNEGNSDNARPASGYFDEYSNDYDFSMYFHDENDSHRGGMYRNDITIVKNNDNFENTTQMKGNIPEIFIDNGKLDGDYDDGNDENKLVDSHWLDEDVYDVDLNISVTPEKIFEKTERKQSLLIQSTDNHASTVLSQQDLLKSKNPTGRKLSVMFQPQDRKKSILVQEPKIVDEEKIIHFKHDEVSVTDSTQSLLDQPHCLPSKYEDILEAVTFDFFIFSAENLFHDKESKYSVFETYVKVKWNDEVFGCTPLTKALEVDTPYFEFDETQRYPFFYNFSEASRLQTIFLEVWAKKPSEYEQKKDILTIEEVDENLESSSSNNNNNINNNTDNDDADELLLGWCEFTSTELQEWAEEAFEYSEFCIRRNFDLKSTIENLHSQPVLLRNPNEGLSGRINIGIKKLSELESARLIINSQNRRRAIEFQKELELLEQAENVYVARQDAQVTMVRQSFVENSIKNARNTIITHNQKLSTYNLINNRDEREFSNIGKEGVSIFERRKAIEILRRVVRRHAVIIRKNRQKRFWASKTIFNLIMIKFIIPKRAKNILSEFFLSVINYRRGVRREVTGYISHKFIKRLIGTVSFSVANNRVSKYCVEKVTDTIVDEYISSTLNYQVTKILSEKLNLVYEKVLSNVFEQFCSLAVSQVIAADKAVEESMVISIFDELLNANINTIGIQSYSDLKKEKNDEIRAFEMYSVTTKCDLLYIKSLPFVGLMKFVISIILSKDFNKAQRDTNDKRKQMLDAFPGNLPQTLMIFDFNKVSNLNGSGDEQVSAAKNKINIANNLKWVWYFTETATDGNGNTYNKLVVKKLSRSDFIQKMIEYQLEFYPSSDYIGKLYRLIGDDKYEIEFLTTVVLFEILAETADSNSNLSQHSKFNLREGDFIQPLVDMNNRPELYLQYKLKTTSNKKVMTSEWSYLQNAQNDSIDWPSLTKSCESATYKFIKSYEKLIGKRVRDFNANFILDESNHPTINFFDSIRDPFSPLVTCGFDIKKFSIDAIGNVLQRLDSLTRTQAVTLQKQRLHITKLVAKTAVSNILMTALPEAYSYCIKMRRLEFTSKISRFVSSVVTRKCLSRYNVIDARGIAQQLTKNVVDNYLSVNLRSLIYESVAKQTTNEVVSDVVNSWHSKVIEPGIDRHLDNLRGHAIHWGALLFEVSRTNLSTFGDQKFSFIAGRENINPFNIPDTIIFERKFEVTRKRDNHILGLKWYLTSKKGEIIAQDINEDNMYTVMTRFEQQKKRYSCSSIYEQTQREMLNEQDLQDIVFQCIVGEVSKMDKTKMKNILSSSIGLQLHVPFTKSKLFLFRVRYRYPYKDLGVQVDWLQCVDGTSNTFEKCEQSNTHHYDGAIRCLEIVYFLQNLLNKSIIDMTAEFIVDKSENLWLSYIPWLGTQLSLTPTMDLEMYKSLFRKFIDFNLKRSEVDSNSLALNDGDDEFYRKYILSTSPCIQSEVQSSSLSISRPTNMAGEVEAERNFDFRRIKSRGESRSRGGGSKGGSRGQSRGGTRSFATVGEEAIDWHFDLLSRPASRAVTAGQNDFYVHQADVESTTTPGISPYPLLWADILDEIVDSKAAINIFIPPTIRVTYYKGYGDEINASVYYTNSAGIVSKTSINSKRQLMKVFVGGNSDLLDSIVGYLQSPFPEDFDNVARFPIITYQLIDDFDDFLNHMMVERHLFQTSVLDAINNNVLWLVACTYKSANYSKEMKVDLETFDLSNAFGVDSDIVDIALMKQMQKKLMSEAVIQSIKERTSKVIEAVELRSKDNVDIVIEEIKLDFCIDNKGVVWLSQSPKIIAFKVVSPIVDFASVQALTSFDVVERVIRSELTEIHDLVYSANSASNSAFSIDFFKFLVLVHYSQFIIDSDNNSLSIPLILDVIFSNNDENNTYSWFSFDSAGYLAMNSMFDWMFAFRRFCMLQTIDNNSTNGDKEGDSTLVYSCHGFARKAVSKSKFLEDLNNSAIGKRYFGKKNHYIQANTTSLQDVERNFLCAYARDENDEYLSFKFQLILMKMNKVKAIDKADISYMIKDQMQSIVLSICSIFSELYQLSLEKINILFSLDSYGHLWIVNASGISLRCQDNLYQAFKPSKLWFEVNDFVNSTRGGDQISTHNGRSNDDVGDFYGSRSYMDADENGGSNFPDAFGTVGGGGAELSKLNGYTSTSISHLHEEIETPIDKLLNYKAPSKVVKKSKSKSFSISKDFSDSAVEQRNSNTKSLVCNDVAENPFGLSPSKTVVGVTCDDCDHFNSFSNNYCFNCGAGMKKINTDDVLNKGRNLTEEKVDLATEKILANISYVCALNNVEVVENDLNSFFGSSDVTIVTKKMKAREVEEVDRKVASSSMNKMKTVIKKSLLSKNTIVASKLKSELIPTSNGMNPESFRTTAIQGGEMFSYIKETKFDEITISDEFLSVEDCREAVGDISTVNLNSDIAKSSNNTNASSIKVETKITDSEEDSKFRTDDENMKVALVKKETSFDGKLDSSSLDPFVGLSKTNDSEDKARVSCVSEEVKAIKTLVLREQESDNVPLPHNEDEMFLESLTGNKVQKKELSSTIVKGRETIHKQNNESIEIDAFSPEKSMETPKINRLKKTDSKKLRDLINMTQNNSGLHKLLLEVDEADEAADDGASGIHQNYKLSDDAISVSEENGEAMVPQSTPKKLDKERFSFLPSQNTTSDLGKSVLADLEKEKMDSQNMDNLNAQTLNNKFVNTLDAHWLAKFDKMREDLREKASKVPIDSRHREILFREELSIRKAHAANQKQKFVINKQQKTVGLYKSPISTKFDEQNIEPKGLTDVNDSSTSIDDNFSMLKTSPSNIKNDDVGSILSNTPKPTPTAIPFDLDPDDDSIPWNYRESKNENSKDLTFKDNSNLHNTKRNKVLDEENNEKFTKKMISESIVTASKDERFLFPIDRDGTIDEEDPDSVFRDVSLDEDSVSAKEKDDHDSMSFVSVESMESLHSADSSDFKFNINSSQSKVTIKSFETLDENKLFNSVSVNAQQPPPQPTPKPGGFASASSVVPKPPPVHTNKSTQNASEFRNRKYKIAHSGDFWPALTLPMEITSGDFVGSSEPSKIYPDQRTHQSISKHVLKIRGNVLNAETNCLLGSHLETLSELSLDVDKLAVSTGMKSQRFKARNYGFREALELIFKYRVDLAFEKVYFSDFIFHKTPTTVNGQENNFSLDYSNSIDSLGSNDLQPGNLADFFDNRFECKFLFYFSNKSSKSNPNVPSVSLVKHQCTLSEFSSFLESRYLASKKLLESVDVTGSQHARKLKALNSQKNVETVFTATALSKNSEFIKGYYYKENWASEILCDLQSSSANGLQYEDLYIASALASENMSASSRFSCIYLYNEDGIKQNRKESQNRKLGSLPLTTSLKINKIYFSFNNNQPIVEECADVSITYLLNQFVSDFVRSFELKLGDGKKVSKFQFDCVRDVNNDICIVKVSCLRIDQPISRKVNDEKPKGKANKGYNANLSGKPEVSINKMSWAHFLKLSAGTLKIPILSTLIFAPYITSNSEDIFWGCYYNGNQGFLLQNKFLHNIETIVKSFETYARRHSVTSLHDTDKYSSKNQDFKESEQKACIVAYHMITKAKYYLSQTELYDLLCYEDSCEYYYQALIHSALSDNRLVSIVFNRVLCENNCTIQISLEDDFPVVSELELSKLHRNINYSKSSELRWKNIALDSGISCMKNILASLEIKGVECLRIRALFLLDTKEMLWLSRVCEVDWVTQSCASYEPEFVSGSKIISKTGSFNSNVNILFS